MLLVGAIRELEAKIESDQKLERNEVLIVEDRFADAAAGEGIARLNTVSDEFSNDKMIKIFADAQVVPEIDRVARSITVSGTATKVREGLLE
jgi:hypothetical protein